MRSLATVESKKAWTLKPLPAGLGHTTPYFFTQKTTLLPRQNQGAARIMVCLKL